MRQKKNGTIGSAHTGDNLRLLIRNFSWPGYFDDDDNETFLSNLYNGNLDDHCGCSKSCAVL